MPSHSPHDVIQAFRASGRPIDEASAHRIAEAIAARGGLDQAAAGLANDERPRALAELLAYRAALEEAPAPARRVARLQRDADDLDVRAEPLWREAAEFHGRSAFRRLMGEAELADQFLARAAAAERLAAGLEADALAMRIQAAGLRAGAGVSQQFGDLLTALVA